MGYINDFCSEFRARIAQGETEAAVKYAADTVLQSYRNSQEAGKGDRAEGAKRSERPAKAGPRKNAPRQSGRHY